MHVIGKRPYCYTTTVFKSRYMHGCVDPALALKITEKIQETMGRSVEIQAIADLLSDSATDDFVHGIIAGRLYNSFYYQCRRIKKRDPKPAEIREFLDIVASNWDRIIAKLQAQ